jgi:hypothetical protein
MSLLLLTQLPLGPVPGSQGSSTSGLVLTAIFGLIIPLSGFAVSNFECSRISDAYHRRVALWRGKLYLRASLHASTFLQLDRAPRQL